MYVFGEEYKDFRSIPKNRKRKAYGDVYTRMLEQWLQVDLGFFNVVWDSEGPVDFPMDRFIQIEAKRLTYTKFGSLGIAWLRRNILERFSPYARIKIACVTTRKWRAESQRFLEGNGISVIVTGAVGRKDEAEEARKQFIDQFTDVLLSRKEDLCEKVAIH